MPRDGSGIYSQPFPNVIEGTTIESPVYNGFVSDVVIDLNTPRPVIAGGTGSDNLHDAMIALGGEIGSQGPVTNYDDFPFVDGSFYSNPGATNAPDGVTSGSYIAGIAYAKGLSATVLEARIISGSGSINAKYVRTKVSGSWSAWIEQAAAIVDLSSVYVNTTGDTMTGTLNGVTAGTYEFTLQDSGTGRKYGLAVAGVTGNFTFDDMTAGVSRFNITPAGHYTISGTATIAGNTNVIGNVNAGDIYAVRTANTGYYFYGSNTLQYIGFNGTAFDVIGGQLNVHSNLNVIGATQYLNGISFATRASGYTIVYNGDGTAGSLQMGGAGDQTNYYRNTSHQFQNKDGSVTYASAGAAGIATPALVVGGIPVYGNMPVVNITDGYNTVATDNGKCLAGVGTAWIINDGRHPVGTVLTFAGYGGVLTISCYASGVFHWIGPSGILTGNRTIADRGICTIIRVLDGNWIVAGNGVT